MRSWKVQSHQLPQDGQRARLAEVGEAEDHADQPARSARGARGHRAGRWRSSHHGALCGLPPAPSSRRSIGSQQRVARAADESRPRAERLQVSPDDRPVGERDDAAQRRRRRRRRAAARRTRSRSPDHLEALRPRWRVAGDGETALVECGLLQRVLAGAAVLHRAPFRPAVHDRHGEGASLDGEAADGVGREAVDAELAEALGGRPSCEER